MGQYYSINTNNKDENLEWTMQSTYFRKTRDFNFRNGLKLMEHSYYKCDLIEAFSHYIYKNPTRVWWVGDYSDPIVADEKVLRDMIKGDEYDFDILEPFDYSDVYCINHTKKIAFKMVSNPTNDTVYPVSLLTAVGNDRGSGDYHKGTNFELVGTWAGDEISLDTEIPEGYTEINTIEFIEDR